MIESFCRCPGCGSCDNAKKVEELERVLSNIEMWTHAYGKSLCPGSKPDTFGEGMRAAKDQVSEILRRGVR